jgi:hypothetical protein
MKRIFGRRKKRTARARLGTFLSFTIMADETLLHSLCGMDVLRFALNVFPFNPPP